MGSNDMFYRNPANMQKKLADYEEFKKTTPAKYPKLSDLFDKIKYKHGDRTFGISLGMQEEQAKVMAEKFRRAEEQARKENPTGQILSRTVAIVAPTLSPEELAFCVGLVILEKQKAMNGDDPLRILKDLLGGGGAL